MGRCGSKARISRIIPGSLTIRASTWIAASAGNAYVYSVSTVKHGGLHFFQIACRNQ
jgi:hypothetical protein